MRPSPAESKWASKCLRSPTTQHACGGVPAAKNSITPQSFASKPYRSVHGAGGGGRGHGGEGCSASPSCPNCSGPHNAAWLGCPEYRTRLLANKIKSQTCMPYNHTIRQVQTDTIQQHRNQQTCTHNPTILIRGPAPKPTTNSNTQNSYLCKYC